MAGDVIELQANAADAIDLRPTWFISDSTVNETVVITEEEKTKKKKNGTIDLLLLLLLGRKQIKT